MADETAIGSKYFLMIMTGLVSLAVGVGGGLILYQLTTAKANLEYELKTSEVFSGQKENIAIFALQVRNSGKKEIEDLVCRVDLKDSELQEPKITGLPSSSFTSSQGSNFFQLKSPFLNPHESFSVQLLLTLRSQTLTKPAIRVRGKGITAEERTSVDIEKKDKPLAISLAAAISTMIIPLFLILEQRLKPEFFFTKRHKDDQRDVLAFVFALNGFAELASVTRQSERKQFYWSTADALTEHCLAKGDEQVLRSGVKALIDLIGYADMALTSKLLIHYNIARLAVRIPDKALAEEHLGEARKGKHKVIEKRITLDPELAAIAQSALQLEGT